MISWVQNLNNLRSCDCPLTNLQFDLVVSSAALISVYFQQEGKFFLGFQAFAVSTLADRAIKWICTRGYQIPVNSEEKLLPGIFGGLVSVGVEELFYTCALLNTQRTVFFTVLRFVVSTILGEGVSSSIRPSDQSPRLGVQKKHREWDAVAGLSWAVCREVVIRCIDSEKAFHFSVLSNSLIFGLLERVKFTGLLRTYKLTTSIALRALWSYYAVGGADRQLNIVPPLFAHTLFNISRCLPGSRRVLA
ncbi:MAG: hypothetical protein JSS10_07600 [Verrucomicrobia bacterium]|nr:hypothetical protein [Verrucomicrobiota bacterium]